MNILPHQDKIYKICKTIVRYSPDEDHRDLAHNVFLGLINAQEPEYVTDSWLLTVCCNKWRDHVKAKNLRRADGHLLNMISACYISSTYIDPTIGMIAKELGIDTDNWPGRYKPDNTKRVALFNAIYGK